MTPRPICAFDVFPDGSARAAPDLATGSIEGAAYRWFHFDLTDDGVAEWCVDALPERAASALTAIETRPRVTQHEGGLILALRGININSGADLADMVALRIWMTETLVVTVRRRKIFAVDELRQRTEAGRAPVSPAEFLIDLLDLLVGRIEQVSLDLEEDTDEMEAAVYDDYQSAPPDLAARRRQVIRLRRFVGPQTDALARLADATTPVLPPDLRFRFLEIANRATHSVEELAEVRERLTALSDHLDLVQTARLGHNGYVISIIAAIFMPLGFLTGLFGVNLGGIPGASSPVGFWVLSGAMVAVGAAAAIWLRWRKWL